MDKLQKEIRAKDLKRKENILEAIGDIAKTDISPPDTVLFVCKLNKVTQEK